MASILTDIKKGKLHVWSSELNKHKGLYQHYLSLLDSNEHAQAKRITNELAHQMYVLSHGWLRIVLSKYLVCHPHHLFIVKTLYGKPYLEDYPRLVFNLSHCSEKMLLAVAFDCQLGADIETYEPRAGLNNIAKSCFSYEELNHWNMLPDKSKTTFFYQLWTRKEAFFKATGIGISTGLQECVINPNSLNSFLRLPSEHVVLDTWKITNLNLWPDASTITVANKNFSSVILLT